MKGELESKVGKDDRSRLITNSLNDKLQKKYAPKREAKLYALLVKSVTADFYESKWELPPNTAFAIANPPVCSGRRIVSTPMIALPPPPPID